MRAPKPLRGLDYRVALSVFALTTSAVLPQTATAQLPSTEQRQQQTAKRVALVIGNGAYEHLPKLENPTRDADLISAALKRAGFQVDTAHDLDLTGLNNAVKTFARKAQASDVAVVYFAGHGIQNNNHDYLVPVDADLETAADVQIVGTQSLDFETFKLAASAKVLGFIVVDACRDNPVNGKAGLVAVDPPPNAVVAFSASQGSVAEDGMMNGPFAAALAKAITTPGLDIRKLVSEVIDDVKSNTGNRQVPILNPGSLGARDIFLVPPSQTADADPGPVQAGPNRSINPAPISIYSGIEKQQDAEFWNSIKDSSDPSLFEAYLMQVTNGVFPGAFAPLARAKLAKLSPNSTLLMAPSGPQGNAGAVSQAGKVSNDIAEKKPPKNDEPEAPKDVAGPTTPATGKVASVSQANNADKNIAENKPAKGDKPQTPKDKPTPTSGADSVSKADNVDKDMAENKLPKDDKSPQGAKELTVPPTPAPPAPKGGSAQVAQEMPSRTAPRSRNIDTVSQADIDKVIAESTPSTGVKPQAPNNVVPALPIPSTGGAGLQDTAGKDTKKAPGEPGFTDKAYGAVADAATDAAGAVKDVTTRVAPVVQEKLKKGFDAVTEIFGRKDSAAPTPQQQATLVPAPSNPPATIPVQPPAPVFTQVPPVPQELTPRELIPSSTPLPTLGNPPVLPIATLPLHPKVAEAVQRARDAEAKARERADAAREAQARAQTAAAKARANADRAAANPDGNDVVVQAFADLGTYRGDISAGVRQGAGVWVGDDGERYRGEWQGDNRNGVGVSDPSNKIRFEGTWKDGKPCGVGVLSWPNGDRYEGDYCDGHYTGYGVFHFSAVSNKNFARENTGQWDQDKQTGFGIRLWAGGYRSEGQWLNGKLTGYGAEFDTNGQVQTKLDVLQEGQYQGDTLKVEMAPAR